MDPITTSLSQAVSGRSAFAAVLPAAVVLLAGSTLWTTHGANLSRSITAKVPQTGSGVRSSHGMVVSATEYASRIGVDVLQAGGNAVDAAIATGFALAVTHPAAGNIGGGGFMVIRFPDGSVTAFDYREKAPLAANPRMFLDEDGEYSSRIHHNSHKAVGVPGTVAGFVKAHESYGTGDWSRLVEPSVRLARDGFAVMPGLARSLQYALARMEPYPASIAAFSKDGEPYQVGEILRQPELASTLERIMLQGHDGFYKGETARLIAAEMQRGGGLITEEDLAIYRARERTPITGSYRGYDVISMPPPSSGGTILVEMLNILEGFDLASMGHNSSAYIHHVTEAMRRAYLDRARFLADPAYADVPVERLTSKDYAAELRRSIEPHRATPSNPLDIELPHESPHTTHYSVVDAAGMAVAVTYTLEAGYGSKIVVPGAGFLLNNEMGDFNPQQGLTDSLGHIGSEPNLARPGQRMLSSMTPTILAKEGELVAVVGSPGGRTIINSVLQVVLNIIDFEMPIQDAVNASRLHHAWLPNTVRVEQGGIDEATKQALQEMGHRMIVRGRQGLTHCIMIDPLTGERIGAADPRDTDAVAVGY
ncbi:MAG: gamma-glutamyltransferase [Gemmatimonadota bacterium]|nr:MAG: gamma-glutamyltransferase [Gemmatimonadota bacterium]